MIFSQIFLYIYLNTICTENISQFFSILRFSQITFQIIIVFQNIKSTIFENSIPFAILETETGNVRMKSAK